MTFEKLDMYDVESDGSLTYWASSDLTGSCNKKGAQKRANLTRMPCVLKGSKSGRLVLRVEPQEGVYSRG